MRFSMVDSIMVPFMSPLGLYVGMLVGSLPSHACTTYKIMLPGLPSSSSRSCRKIFQCIDSLIYLIGYGLRVGRACDNAKTLTQILCFNPQLFSDRAVKTPAKQG